VLLEIHQHLQWAMPEVREMLLGGEGGGGDSGLGQVCARLEMLRRKMQRKARETFAEFEEAVRADTASCQHKVGCIPSAGY
jgi:hypothetical protein